MISGSMSMQHPSVSFTLAPRLRLGRRRGGLPLGRAPRPARLSTLRLSSAHFMRVAEMSIPSSRRTNERSSRSSSSTFMPLTSSEAIDAAAWLIAQPWPLKRTSSTVPSSPTRSITRSSSPQSGLVSSNSRSGSLHLAPVVGALVVLEDLLAVEVVHQAKTSFTRPSPAIEPVDVLGRCCARRTRRARWPCRPSARISGWAQWWPARMQTPSRAEDLGDVVGVHAVQREGDERAAVGRLAAGRGRAGPRRPRRRSSA